jgi:hypothetical protein
MEDFNHTQNMISKYNYTRTRQNMTK